MGCNEKCTAPELSGLAEQNIEYCNGLVDVNFNDSDLQLRNVCGAIIMARVSYGQIMPSEVNLSVHNEARASLPESDDEESYLGLTG
jgi:hypothetical protein